jgi:serine/threonine protein kinase
MLKALHYCHEIVKVIHRDIKPDNIMINHNSEAVLIDFGVSALLEDKKEDPTKQTVGTFIFFAPEMFKEKEHKHLRENVDIWALGVTMYYILTGQHPHHDATDL